MQLTMESDRLAQLALCKLQILQLLRRLAAQQLEIITGGDMSNLLKLLAAKQTVMDQLAKLEQQLDPFRGQDPDRKSTRLNSSHLVIAYAVLCLKKKKEKRAAREF